MLIFGVEMRFRRSKNNCRQTTREQEIVESKALLYNKPSDSVEGRLK